MTNLQEHITRVIIETCGLDPHDDAPKITMECNLTTTLGIDELDAVEIIIELESSLEIAINDDDVDATNLTMEALHAAIQAATDETYD